MANWLCTFNCFPCYLSNSSNPQKNIYTTLEITENASHMPNFVEFPKDIVQMRSEQGKTDQLRHHAAAKSLQSCPTLGDPIDGSPPGSHVPGILQARTLEWVAISFSHAWKLKSQSEVAQSYPTLSDPMDCSLVLSLFKLVPAPGGLWTKSLLQEMFRLTSHANIGHGNFAHLRYIKRNNLLWWQMF